MRENRQRISCAEVRQWDMVTFLSRLGYEPDKIKGRNYWYKSPLRNERTASFKVNRNKNRWYDFGEGTGGSLVDFGIRYYQCSVSDFLQLVRSDFSLPRPAFIPPLRIPEKETDKILIESVGDLQHPALLQYLESRQILLSLAGRYCVEVTYQNQGKTFFALGFKNNSGGHELRSRYFKGSSSPKDYTLIQKGNTSLIVVEGFIDFLSCLTLFPDACNASDFLILNSLSFFSRADRVIGNYRNQHFYLDNNKAGKACTKQALALYPHSIDRSYLYTGYEDLNDYLCNKPMADDLGKNMQESDDPP